MAATTGELRQEIAQRREDLGRDLDALGDKISPSRMAQRKTERVTRRAQRMRDAVMGTVEDAEHQAAATARQVPDATRQQVEGNPLAAGVIAFGAGMLVSALLPASKPERDLARMAEPAVRAASDELRSTGQGLVDELREPAREAAEQLKETAAGSAEDVRTTAQSTMGLSPDPPAPLQPF
jgi:ElaB/YqjD/DUF883 family membrane-anchored ribosome-binding protein